MNPSMCKDKEILIEILSRLPAKALVRFMSVCRLWKSIITSPQFRLVSNRPTRLLVHTNRECYTVVEDEEDDENADHVVFETDFPLRHLSYERAIIKGSDNGLICAAIYSFSPHGKVYPWFIIWNPCIRKHVVIPDHPWREGYFLEYSTGFGATISGLDYKFVSVGGYTVTVDECGGTRQKAFHIYSLKAGTWRRFYLDYESYLNMSFSRFPALLRGRLHWVVNESSFLKNSNYISTLELEDEVFENNTMMLPQHLSTAPSLLFTLEVTVFKESLAVIAYEHGRNCTFWVMQEYGDVGSWVKLWSIDQTMKDFDMFVSSKVRMLKNGNLLLKLYGLECPPKLVTCNPKTMKTKDFGCGVLSPSEVCGFTNNYKESLVLLADDDRAVPDHRFLSMFYPSQRDSAPVLPMYFQDEFGYYYVWTGFHWLLLGHIPGPVYIN